MATTKRPNQPNVKTDEWGLYDPNTAGMPALFARLGKPVLRQSADSARREKRRALRPERSNDGVCLAIEEVRRRAFPDPELVAQAPPSLTPVAPPLVKMAPAAEISKRARRASAGASKKSADQTRHSMRNALIEAAAKAEAKTAARPAKRSAAVTARVETPEPAPAPAPALPPAPPPVQKVARARKIAAAPKATPRAASASPAREPKRPAGVPPPSPRRPRGPVPLAAWAHAVTDAPVKEPKRHDARGLWRSLFKIPSEVALIQYGRGCRIHRLVIEEPAETADFY